MPQLPARETLSSYLIGQQARVLEQYRAQLDAAPELDAVRKLAQMPGYDRGTSTLLRLLIAQLANPRDRRCFAFAHQRALDHFSHGVPAGQMMRLAGIYRHTVLRLLDAHFRDEPAICGRLCELVDLQAGELEVTFADAYQAARDRQWQASESKYFWLFENASEAIVSFRPGEGRLIEANFQAERLLERERADLIGAYLPDLFSAAFRNQVQWLVARPDGNPNVRVDDVSIERGNGGNNGAVPVSLSCNWLSVDGDAVAQVILRDVTHQRQLQVELQSQAEQLEERVRERTLELTASEERFRNLFLQEQRRARHLSLINEVQKCVLASRSIESFFPQVTRAIASHFRECDVTFYLSEAGRYGAQSLDGGEQPQSNDFFVMAAAGEHRLAPEAGSRHSSREGGPPFHGEARSTLSVPLVIDGENAGLVALQSRQAEILDARDVAALMTAAAIIAAHLQSDQLFRNMRELNEFNQGLIDSMLHSLMVVDVAGRIRFVNERLRQIFGRENEELIKQPMEEILGTTPSQHHDLRAIVENVATSGAPHEIPEVHVRADGQNLIFDLRLFRVYFRGEPEVAFLLINLTQRWRKTYQLQLMHEIGRLFQSSLDIDKVLYTVLTCITAGSALGFNRAFVFLLDENKNQLGDAMALGPSSAEEASRIWSEISQYELTLEQILAQDAARRNAPPTPLQERAKTLTLDVGNPCFPALARTLLERRVQLVERETLFVPTGEKATESQKEQCAAASHLFSAREIALAPLVAKEKLVGVVIADNLYSSAPITFDDLQMLDTLAQHAGLTIDNALTYQALQTAQKELVTAERLVAVGEMAARVSHEIRNPLATIGGFARGILKKSGDVGLVERKTGVIVSEVQRLEELLNDLLDMASPRGLDLQPSGVNEIVEHAILLADADIRAAHVEVETDLASDLPLVKLDRRRILQAFLNTIRNGAQAMPDGGVLRVATRLAQRGNGPAILEVEIADSGVGISQRALKQVFDPFFSTKVSGSGLGLAVTKRIIQDHGAHLDVESEEGQGTQFVFGFPVEAEALNSAS